MKVLFATSEAYPFATSGGLGDVAYALPKALKKRIVGTRIIMPLYSKISQQLRDEMHFIKSITVPVAWRNQYCGIFEAKHDGLVYIFLDNEYYFRRDKMYGEFDDAERFAFFSRAVLEAVSVIDFKPDVIHCNDWQSALIPTYYNFFYYNRPGYEGIKTVLTIHNIQYQGRYGLDIMEDTLGIPKWAQPLMENDGDVNILKAGIESANKVTTVSPTYAYEILDPWYAYSLDGILNTRRFKLSGILNGIDYDVYNPESDKSIPVNYTAQTLDKKSENKTALQRQLGLAESPEIPVIAMVTRLVSHKGLELVKYIFDELMYQNIQLVILGSGEQEYEDFFAEKKMQYGDRFAFVCGFVPKLAHEIYAGADMFLMPSKQEPCGLAQMVALRYGTVPIVRQTGGLADSIPDAGMPGGVGYTFQSYNAHDMAGAVYRAIGCYHDKKAWRALQLHGMLVDNSWSRSAGEYIKLYKEVTEKA